MKDKENAVSLHSGEVLSHEEEWNGGHRNMGATGEHLKEKKPEWEMFPELPSPSWILCVYTRDMKGVSITGRKEEKRKERVGG